MTTMARGIGTAGRLAGAALLVALGTASCSSGGGSSVSATVPATAGATVPATAGGASGTVWLCRPGLAADPCAFSPVATAVPASGAARTATLAALPSASKFDCFYVYPTVSDQQTANADLKVQTVEVDVAVAQASLFSQVCNVWAPMYRQATASSIEQGLSGLPGSRSVLRSTFTVAYDSLLSGWQDFLAHDDHGRPIILIGHSQGSAILIHLIATQIDHDPSVLHRLVVAILAGGNLQVPAGQVVGATFDNVPLCTSPTQTGCAIAYSSYPSEPPAASLFGRAGQGVSLQSGQTARAGQQVACVNPAALGGGTADLSPYFLAATQTGLTPAILTPWVTYPGLYSATCQTKDGVTWLQVTDLARSGDSRPVVTEELGPDWGYHADDIGLALGNLVRDVASEEAAWTAAHN